jgi:hypothetical protein
LFPAVIVENLTIDQLRKFYGEVFKFSSESEVAKEHDKTTNVNVKDKGNVDQNSFN